MLWCMQSFSLHHHGPSNQRTACGQQLWVILDIFLVPFPFFHGVWSIWSVTCDTKTFTPHVHSHRYIHMPLPQTFFLSFIQSFLSVFRPSHQIKPFAAANHPYISYLRLILFRHKVDNQVYYLKLSPWRELLVTADCHGPQIRQYFISNQYFTFSHTPGHSTPEPSSYVLLLSAGHNRHPDSCRCARGWGTILGGSQGLWATWPCSL